MATGDRQMRKRSRRRRSRRRAIRQRYGIGLALVLLFLAGGAFAIRRVNDRYAWSRLKESQEATAAEDYGWWGARGQSLSEEGQEIFGEERTPPEVSLEASDYAGWRRLLDENQVSAAFREGAEAFAFDSGSRILRQSEGNVAYSPLSAYQALALAGCGADGETEKEIFRVLKVEDRETLADQCRKLYQQLYYAGQWAQKQSETYGGSGERDQIWLGNALWVSDQVQIDRDYEELAARCFFAPSISINLENPKAGEQMSQWIAQKKAGKIHAAPDLGPEDRMVLMDTLYFYGGWRYPFREADTQKDRFTLESGEEVSCLFLNKTIENGSFRKGEGFTVAYLHTADSKVFFLLPEEGKRLEELLTTPELLKEAMDLEQEGWSVGEVTWKIPRASFQSSIDLRGFLQDMGLERMFGSTAEFGRIARGPLWTTSMVQKTSIGLEEDGLEGAAYTVLESEAADEEEEDPPPHVDMLLDRPFLFGVRWDDEFWLFLGAYRDPTAG